MLIKDDIWIVFRVRSLLFAQLTMLRGTQITFRLKLRIDIEFGLEIIRTQAREKLCDKVTEPPPRWRPESARYECQFDWQERKLRNYKLCTSDSCLLASPLCQNVFGEPFAWLADATWCCARFGLLSAEFCPNSSLRVERCAGSWIEALAACPFFSKEDFFDQT